MIFIAIAKLFLLRAELAEPCPSIASSLISFTVWLLKLQTLNINDHSITVSQSVVR